MYEQDGRLGGQGEILTGLQRGKQGVVSGAKHLDRGYKAIRKHSGSVWLGVLGTDGFGVAETGKTQQDAECLATPTHPQPPLGSGLVDAKEVLSGGLSAPVLVGRGGGPTAPNPID